MHPANQYMDPYHSYCRDHTPYPYYPPPRWEAGHSRMAMDSSCRPPSYGPWPYSGSTSHSCPPEFHRCCNHTYPPGYYSFRPPFSQELPPPYLYYHGPFPFPHHPNAYPSYFVPQSPYPVDQATYDYEKFKSHCCGCPNHICHGGEKSKLKIEEEMPEVKPQSDLKGANDSSIICHPNDQYPMMWLPYGNMKDKGNGRSSELPPQLLSRWVPEGGERTRDMKRLEEDNQKAKQFEWPIIWMPAGYDEPKQEAKRLIEMDKSPKISEDAPPSPKIKVIPLSCFEKGNQDQGPSIKDRSGDHSERLVPISQPASTKHRDGMAVDRNVKTIPVVPEERNNEKEPVGQNKTIPVVPDKESDEKKIGTYRIIPVVNEKEINDKSDNKEGKKAIDAEREGEKGKGKNVGTSKAKPSKLPPVCLRVDPLPRKKSGNGCSRSPSLPNSKDADKDKKGVKQTPSQNLDAKLSDPKKEINMAVVNEKSPGEIEKIVGRKNATVQDAPVKHTQQEQTLQDASTKHTQVEQIPTSTVDQKMKAAVNIETQENASVNPLQECDKTTTEDGMKIQGEAAKFARKREIYFSEPDAAVHIQSAYRGYHVRRWQPVEKLRKIKKVHERMQDVEKQLQDLEAASSQPMVKEQVALNETIMNLLLELDTIQGSHPSVREARKSVTRELICLQEKLDSLCKQPFGDHYHSNSEKASEEEKYAGVCEEPSLCSIMHHEVLPSVSELRQDFAGQKHRMEESSTPKEEEHDEGKAVATGECEGASLMDVMSDAALSGHSTEQKHQMEESNTISTEECPEEEKAAGNGVGSSEHHMEPLHDPASSEGSSMLKRCTSSTEYDRQSEVSNAGVSPATAHDSTTAITGVPVDNDASVESQVRGSASVKSSGLKQAGAPIAEDQSKEQKAPFVQLEDSSVPLENADAHENDSVLAGTSQGSTDQTDGTTEPSVGDENNMDHVTAANAEDSVESSALKQVGAPTEDQSKEPEAPFVQLEDSSVPLENAEAHENDLVLADTSQGSTDQTDGTREPSVGDENNMDHVTAANAEDSVESSALKQDGAPTEDQSKELKAPFVHLEDSSVPLENAEAHENDLVLADTTQGSADQTDGTTEPSVGDENNMDHVTAANAEDSVESSALIKVGALIEEDQNKEPEAPFVHLEDSSVPLENAEAHENDLVLADTSQGSADQTDGTTEPSVGDENNMDQVTAAIAENTVESPLLKETSESDSAFEEAVPLESCTIGKQRRDRLAVPLESKGETVEGTLCVAGTTLPENESSELPCEHDSTGVLENPDSKVSTGSQRDTQKECARGDKTSDGMEASDIVKCKEMLVEAPICAAGASSAELEADSKKEDVGLQTASGEAAPVSVTHDDLKGDDKELAEENQKLKEMLQKLLASGNDQMGVITELTEKVKTLERKLARKKRPKVRVHRQARDATAKGHRRVKMVSEV